MTRYTHAKISQISPTFSYFLINNALLYHFLENWLAHNEKMTEKSVFREAWSPEMTSHSFSVSCFSLAVSYPTGNGGVSRFYESYRSWTSEYSTVVTQVLAHARSLRRWSNRPFPLSEYERTNTWFDNLSDEYDIRIYCTLSIDHFKFNNTPKWQV